VSFGFSVSGSSQKKDSLASGCKLGELVEGECGSFGLMDSVFSGLSEFECADSDALG
jgi:hypothetical protein